MRLKMQNSKLIWKTQQEQVKEFEEQKKTRDTAKYGNDGHIVAGEGKFVYKNIAYLIKVMRYYTFREGFKPLGSQRITDKHAVVEYPDETKPIVDLVKQINDDSEFLWHDTLHSYNDNQTAEEQINQCHKLAKRDIDSLHELPKIIDEKIVALGKLKERVFKEI